MRTIMYMHTGVHILHIAQQAGAVEYSNCISVEGNEPRTSVLVMTLNNLMVRPLILIPQFLCL